MLQGIVTFVEYGGLTYRVLQYTTAAQFATYNMPFVRSLASFDRLTDPKALAAQPMRVQVETVKKRDDIHAVERPASARAIPIAELALINGMAAGDDAGGGAVGEGGAVREAGSRLQASGVENHESGEDRLNPEP